MLADAGAAIYSHGQSIVPMVTTLTVDPKVRDRLKLYGTAGMTYNDILNHLMDEIDRERFVEEIRRLATAEDAWVELKDVDWGP